MLFRILKDSLGTRCSTDWVPDDREQKPVGIHFDVAVEGAKCGDEEFRKILQK